MREPELIDDIPTPALVVEQSTFEANLAAMDAVLPGRRLRPHVKAFKSTALASRLAADGHTGFCCATPREIEGMVAAGLTEDLLLANESLDVARLGALCDQANITVAIDSDATLDAAVAGGIHSVLIDVEVGLPRGHGLRGPPDDGRGPRRKARQGR
jgi:D-threonine aldolase